MDPLLMDPTLFQPQSPITQMPNPQPGPTMPPQGPILANPTQPQPQQPVLASATGNARGSSRMPNQKIGLGEAMMRMGGAGLSAGAVPGGASAGYGAMLDSYGQIQDYNRAREMEAFEIEEARRKAIADRQARAQAAAAKGFETDNEAIGSVRGAIAKLQSAQDMFTQDEDSSLTGYNWTAIASRLTGRTVGNEDEAKRLFLNEIRLDSVMQRVAETKGAISNAEMQLFASQAPTLDSNDVVWKSWLDRQLKLQQKILRRLQTGETIAPDAPLDNDLGGASGGPVTFDPATGKFSDEK